MLAALVARLLPFKASIIVWAFIALLGVVIVQGARLNAAHATVAAKTESIQALQAMMGAQNAGIQAMKDEATRREGLAVKAVAAAKRTGERASARVAHIQSAPVPKSCEGAIEWLVTEGARLEANE